MLVSEKILWTYEMSDPYEAASAIRGVKKGTSTETIYRHFGTESVQRQGCLRGLSLFYDFLT